MHSLRPQVEPHCPIHPDPVPLPSPIPDAIEKAFDDLGSFLEKTLNTTSIVCNSRALVECLTLYSP